MSRLDAKDAGSPGSVNWLLIVLCVVIVIVTSFFLFFWNRLFGWFVGFVLRTLYWKSNNVWLEFDAIQISLLSGRLFIKELRYHSTNQSVRIVKFHITCRYWFWRTRELSDDTKVVGENVHSPKRAPCLIKCVAEGLEWFIYNRTPMYDDILNCMMSESQEQNRFPLKGTATNASRVTRSDYPQAEAVDARTDAAQRRRYSALLRLLIAPVVYVKSFIISLLPKFEFGDFLPISFDLVRGAIMVGNRSTPILLVGAFNRAEGTFQIVPSRSQLDLYKQIYAFKFKDVKIYTRVNKDYYQPMVGHGTAVLNDIKGATGTSPTVPLSLSNFISRKFRSIALGFWRPSLIHESIEMNRWQGLSRYHTQLDTIDRDRSDEYARWSTLLETSMFEMRYYSDVAGSVPANARPTGTEGLETVDVGNGDLAPQWGIDFVIYGGQLHYGPWADRHRRILQDIFALNTYRTRGPTPKLQQGQSRLHSALKIFIELKEEVTLRVPIREVSKNWRYDVLGDLGPSKRSSRPFGWLDVKIGADSTVNYVMSMVASESGYDNFLQIHADKLTVISSVNQSRFLFAESCRILCEMPAPLQWDGRREWVFDVSLSKSTIYLLRDHITLLTDMAKDWSMGPPAEHAKFVPMIYILKLALHDFQLRLNVNDYNVIDFPLVDRQNALVNIAGPSLNTHVSLPFLKYRPLSSTVTFSINTLPLDVSFSLPSWNTHVVLGKSHTINIGSIGSLSLKSSYLYHADVRPDNVDTLRLDMKATLLLFKAYGWAIRQLMIVRDNYFGNFTNFTTRAEYLDKKSLNQVGDPMKQKYRPGQSNMFHVTLNLDVHDSAILLPHELHNCRSAICVKVPKLQLILNTHDYFMEMTLNTFPLSISFIDDCSHMGASDCMRIKGKSISVAGVDINAHRLFGPPPLASTYVCIWEFCLGSVHGSPSLQFLTVLRDCVTVFITNMKDTLNAPAAEFRLDYDPDVTFLAMQLHDVDLAIMSEAAAIRLFLSDGLRFASNDLAGHSYRKVKSVDIPISKVQFLLEDQVERGIAGSRLWLEVGSAEFDLHMDVYHSPPNWQKDAERQILFVQNQDSLTRRVPFLYEQSHESHDRVYQHLNTFLLPFVNTPELAKSPDASPGHDSISTGEISDAFMSSDSGPDSEISKPALYKPGSRHKGVRNPFTDEDISSGDESDSGDDTSFVSNTEFEDDDKFYRSIEEDDSTDTPHSSSFSHAVTPAMAIYRCILCKLELAKDLGGMRFIPKAPGVTPQSHAPSDPTDPLVLSPVQPEQLPAQHNSTLHHAYIRLESRHRNEFMLTPLVSDVVCSILQSQQPKNHYDSLEQLLDRIFIDFMDSHPANAKPRDKTFQFDARSVSWRIRFWQVIQAPPVTELGRTPEQPTAVSLAELVMSFGSVQGSLGPSMITAVNACLGGLYVNVRSGSISALGYSKPSGIAMGPSSIDIQKDQQGVTISAILGNVRIQLDDTSPGVTYGTAMAYAYPFVRIIRLVTSQGKSSRAAQQSLVSTLLSLSSTAHGGAHPLSLIQVSFMVTSGTPQAIRSDPFLSIFTLLLQSIRSLTPAEKAEIMDMPSTRSRDLLDVNELRSEFVSLLKEKSSLGMLDLDDEQISSLHILDLLFPTQHEDTQVPTLVGVTLLIRHWNVSLRDAVPNTEISIDAVDLQVRSGIRDLGTLVTKATGQSARDIVVQHIVLHLGVSGVKFNVLPTALSFVRSLLRLQRFRTISLPNANAPSPQPSDRGSNSKIPIFLEAFLDISRLDVRTSAQLLDVNLKLVGAQAGTSLIMRRNAAPIQDFSSSIHGSLNEFQIQARSAEDSQTQTSDRAILAELKLLGAAFYAGRSSNKLRMTAGVQHAGARVPRSAIKLYHFIKEWESEYLPAYNAMFKGLLSEIEEPAQSSSTPKVDSSYLKQDLDVQATLGTFSVSLHVMHGAWFAWSIHDSLAFGRRLNTQILSYGVHVASQTISISSTDMIGSHGSDGAPAVKLGLPSCRLTGVLEGTRVHATLLIDRFKLMLKPKYVDDILTVQQKFGNDFNDLLDLVTGPHTNLVKRPAPLRKKLTFHLNIQSKGFAIGLRGPTSVQSLEAPLARATVRSASRRGLQWLAEAKGLNLSLEHDTSLPFSSSKYVEPYTSAFMTLDCSVHNEVYPTGSDAADTQHLSISVDKVHALMVPAAISELGNLVDHVQAEMLLRKEQRALELEEMKKKTQRVLQSFESQTQTQHRTSPLLNRTMSFSVRSIGIVFPLTLGSEGESMSPSSPLNTLTERSPAFLFSVAAMDFVTRREETGSVRMQRCAFQFISSFDRNNPKHFESASHGTLDCMLCPEMTVEVVSRVSASSRMVLARAAVSGFELDVSPALPGYIFSMIDVYREGKEHFSRFVPQLRDETPSATFGSFPGSSVDSKYLTLPTSNVRVGFEFQSGRIRFHAPASRGAHRRSSTLPHWGEESVFQDFTRALPSESDVFDLPNLSVWVEYRALPAARRASAPGHVPNGTQSRLSFNARLHSSRNTIQPTVLPFLTEVTRQIEERLADQLTERTTAPTRVLPTTPNEESTQPNIIQATELTFSLCIDESQFELTCLPDVNVLAGVHWKSGGFLLRISPGAREFGLMGSVEDITIRLRHGYLVEDCLNASARNLTFSVELRGTGGNQGSLANCLSIVANSEIDGSVRFGRLQDVLCFKAVWLDRIPILDALAKSSPAISAGPLPADSASLQKIPLVTSILVQLEAVQLEVDLGHAITKLTLEIRPVVLRTKLTDDFSEISLTLEEVKLDAIRRISGRISFPSVSFETVRRRHTSPDSHESTLLELFIHVRGIHASLNYDRKKVLLLRCDPIEAKVFDEWPRDTSVGDLAEPHVRLNFAVVGGDIGAAARIMLVSELILVGGKVSSLLQSQKEGAARESKAFRATRVPEPQNPLSRVAGAMIKSARSKFKEAGRTKLMIVQEMHLHLARLRVAIFNQSDTKMTQFEAVEIQGDLLRNVQSLDQPPFRDLNLALHSFEVRGGDMPATEKWLDFYAGAKVFTMPEMNISMQSTEFEADKRLDYEFRSTFPQIRAAYGNAVRSSTGDRESSGGNWESRQDAKYDPSRLAELPNATEPHMPMGALSSENPNPSDSLPKEDGTTLPPIRTTSSAVPDASKVGIGGLRYHCISRIIETPKLHQLGAASPDLETFKQWTNISIRDSLPVWVHEYATVPIEQLMKALLELYLNQLKKQYTPESLEN
ncbi:uncharacterized protein EI90DRAFT_3157032 [Cantharellus anzutake]|uniref:uncharacterized protein n=1 Tax=Cantharellus anzutake TaxID=1750568 RepID=UPI001904C8A9|nr:uncharacterized protein EI90DRAFT_3157032 [Cantharellus anzutake]KAF8325178.1 hypothetical protein EI90DRAFT_3157032 [Cantharellus anzutake]